MFSISKNKETSVYDINERNEKIIKSCASYNDARSYVRFLKKGGAFAGYTPDFMLKRFNAK